MENKELFIFRCVIEILIYNIYYLVKKFLSEIIIRFEIKSFKCLMEKFFELNDISFRSTDGALTLNFEK